ncbi:hypothetical protein [Mycolicibacterium phlei]|uniref:hypothetical protein n=1 Tax=Mycolicibacterium phlei TaxID=1771 RepID=UPI0037CA9B02
MPTKLAAAIVAAGVVSTGAVVAVPDDRSAHVITAEVAPTSIVTDLLYNFGDVVNGTIGAVTVISDANTSLPFDISTATLIALNTPSIAPNLFSWLVQRYLNPSDYYPPEAYTYAWDFKASLELIASTLPPVLSTPIINGLNDIADGIGAFLEDNLASALPGIVATDYFWEESDIGRTVWAANLAATVPIYLTYNVVRYLGYLPATLEATVESALRDPSEIPNLLSYLVHGVAGPGGLLQTLATILTDPLVALPGPLSTLTEQIRDAVFDGVDNLLSLLPTPIAPTPFASPSLLQQKSDSEVYRTADDEEFSGLQASIEDEGTGDEGGEAKAGDDGAPADDVPPADDLAPADDDAEGDDVAPKLPGTAKVKTGNKFVPGGTTAVDDDTTGGDAPEAETPDPEPNDEGAGDGAGEDTGSNESAGATA